MYQLAPCVAGDVFLLQFVLALADTVHRVGRLRRVAETVGVAAADVDDGFAVARCWLCSSKYMFLREISLPLPPSAPFNTAAAAV